MTSSLREWLRSQKLPSSDFSPYTRVLTFFLEKVLAICTLSEAITSYFFCKVHGIHAGYPCCSISAQNCHQKSFRDKESKTGSGYHAMLGLVKKFPCILYVLLENVRGMLQSRKQFDSEVPMDIQQKALKSLGFQCVFSCLLNSSKFGLAQSRTRSWSLFVRQTNVRLG